MKFLQIAMVALATIFILIMIFFRDFAFPVGIGIFLLLIVTVQEYRQKSSFFKKDGTGKRKRIVTGVFFVLSIILIAGMFWSQPEETEPSAAVSFFATVLEVTETQLLVQPEAGSAELKSSDKIWVSLETELVAGDGQKIGMDDFLIDDEVYITYNGIILESYPAILGEVFHIKRLR